MQSSILTDLDALNNMAVFLLNKDPIFSSALEIFILTMESVKANKMFIPKTGLVDGMIKEIFNEKNGNKLDP